MARPRTTHVEIIDNTGFLTFKNGITVTFDAEDLDIVNRTSWLIAPHGRTTYCGSWSSGRTPYLHRQVMAKHHGAKALSKKVVDHIDGNGLNCCKSNLRLVSHSENLLNGPRRKRRNPDLPDSGLRHVYFSHTRKNGQHSWYVSVRVDGVSHYRGTFRDLRAAGEAADLLNLTVRPAKILPIADRVLNYPHKLGAYKAQLGLV